MFRGNRQDQARRIILRTHQEALFDEPRDHRSQGRGHNIQGRCQGIEVSGRLAVMVAPRHRMEQDQRPLFVPQRCLGVPARAGQRGGVKDAV